MTRSSYLALLSAALAFAAAAYAAPATAPRMPAGLPQSAALLLRFDADNNGTVTREEMEAGLKADFAAADTNGDGCLNPAEVSAENARRLVRDGSQTSPLRDWNLDGCVDMREFSNTAHSYFDLADRRKDGKVTLLELRGPSMPMAPPVQLSRQQIEQRQREQQQQQSSGFQGSVGSNTQNGRY